VSLALWARGDTPPEHRPGARGLPASRELALALAQDGELLRPATRLELRAQMRNQKQSYESTRSHEASPEEWLLACTEGGCVSGMCRTSTFSQAVRNATVGQVLVVEWGIVGGR